MKKMFIIMLLVFCITLTGCRSNSNNKKTSPKKNVDNTKNITLKLGNETYTFKTASEDCGNYSIQSNVIFTNEVDENGDLKGSYEFYECNEGNVNLETANGTYQVNDLEVTFTDSYGQVIDFEITDDDTIVQKKDFEAVKTFTK